MCECGYEIIPITTSRAHNVPRQKYPRRKGKPTDIRSSRRDRRTGGSIDEGGKHRSLNGRGRQRLPRRYRV